MRNKGSVLKILLAIAGFMVLTAIFFGSTLLIVDYFIQDAVMPQIPVITEKDHQEGNLKDESIPKGDSIAKAESIPKYDSYNYLNDPEKAAYQKIVEGLLNYKTKISISGVDTVEIERILMAIDNDHPEIFWVEELAYYFNQQTDQVSQVEAHYDYDQSEKDARQNEINSAYAVFLTTIDAGMDDYEIVKATYEYVVKNTVYGENEEDQNIYSVFGKRESVCAGYAKAMKFLLDRQKIECSYVAGFVDVQGAHAWNLVLIDGDYYYVDATWGEFDGDYSDPENNISYDYFCVTTKTLEITHEIDMSLVAYPEFTATAANYFVRENRLYDLSNDDEKMRLKNDVLEEKRGDEKYFYFAVSDDAMVNTAEAIMDEALGNYTFFIDQKLRTFTVTLY